MALVVVGGVLFLIYFLKKLKVEIFRFTIAGSHFMNQKRSNNNLDETCIKYTTPGNSLKRA